MNNDLVWNGDFKMGWSKLPNAEKILAVSIAVFFCSWTLGEISSSEHLKGLSSTTVTLALALYLLVLKPQQDKAVSQYKEFRQKNGFWRAPRTDVNDYPGVKEMGGVETIDNAVCLYIGMDKFFNK